MKGGEILNIITTTDCHKVTFTREEFRHAMSSEENLREFYYQLIGMCAENERRILANENDKT